MTLQARLFGGDYDPTRTRILHLVSNPTTELDRLQDKAAVEKLKEENTQLRATLARAQAEGRYAPRRRQGCSQHTTSCFRPPGSGATVDAVTPLHCIWGTSIC